MPIKEIYWRNPDKHRSDQRKYDARYRGNPNIRYKTFKQVAEARDIKFEISYKDFLEIRNQRCFYCHSTDRGKMGLDRIDCWSHYHKNNVVPCCGSCNMMRKRMNQDEFIKQCKLIAKAHSG